MALTLAGVALLTLRDHRIPIPWLEGVELIGILLTIAIIWLMVIASTNFGIVLDAQGVTVFVRLTARGRLGRTLYAWSDLSRPSIPGRFWQTVQFETLERALFLDFRQARAVLSDARYPFRREVPQKVWDAIQTQSTPVPRIK